MHISSNDSFLSVERVGQKGLTRFWRIKAAVSGAGCIAAVYGRLRVKATDETLQRVANFAAHRAQRFDLRLPKGGWLRIKRGPSGRTLVRYRVGQPSAGAALEGEVRLDGETAEACCRELGGLL